MGILLAFLSSAIPPITVAIIGVLPYLHTYSLIMRILIEFAIWCSAFILYVYVSTPKQKESVLSVLNYSIKQWVGCFLGIAMFIFVGAWLSANSLGPFVEWLPNESYLAQFEVKNIETQGSKYKSLNLELTSANDGKNYYLTLSKQRFNSSELNRGDRILLQGKQNLFGVYIENFERVEAIEVYE